MFTFNTIVISNNFKKSAYLKYRSFYLFYLLYSFKFHFSLPTFIIFISLQLFFRKICLPMLEQDIQKRIVSIQFGLMSPEETKKGSVVHVIHPETVENGIPKENGLIDLRMGTTERNFLCQTCNSSSFECVGHYGHIELTKPMFHIGYLSRIKKTLECVCFYCSKIKISKTKLVPGLENCWTALKTKSICEGEETSEGRTGCGNKQPMIKKDGLNLIAFMKESDDGEGKVVLNGDKVYNILKKIPQEDFEFLGFDSVNCRPEWMMLTTIIVPPPAVRPSIVLNGHLRAEDDLTHKLSDIVKSNAYLKKYEQEGAPSHIVRDYEQLLQFHLATLIDNDIGGQPQALQKSGRPLKSISARLKGKEGRVRGNLMGKRVDFSARSVISPDPNISVGEVGVPVQIAKIHTFPEKVNSFNIDFLQSLVNTGPNEHPGANYVIRTDGQKIDLNFNRQDLKLEKGFIVERHILNNDQVLFNRQPSLHKMSMMGHKVKIMKGKSFRLNLSAASPYNADFDGDEMNLHVPQTYNTKSELINLTAVSKQIVSPQSNKPVIGIVQDTLVGSRLFTLRDVFFNKREVMSLLYNINSFAKKGQDISDFLKPTILHPVELWTGKQIFSAILPRVFYARETNGGVTEYDDKDWTTVNLSDSRVVIKNGILLAGSIDKRSVGAQQGGLIHIIYNDFGSEAAQVFIDNIQRLVNYFLFYISSFSVGIGDCIADPKTHSICKSTVKGAIDDVDGVISMTKRNELEKMPGMNLIETFESKVNSILNKARNVSGSLAQKSLNSQNNMKSMVISGSKGSYINISQITTCLGQQNVEGKRIPFGFVDRSLPHLYKYDFSAKSRGFVKNSYITGMGPHEFFFHAMGGREGIIDTAIKTAETGYIQRRLVKALEDATIHYDFSVRNGIGDIYQFEYGDDMFDATHLESVSVSFENFKENRLIDMFGEDDKYSIKPNQVSSEVYQLMRDDLELQKLLDKEYDYLLNNMYLLKDSYHSPVNISRLLQKYKKSNDDTISPYIILKMLDDAMTDNLKLNYYIRTVLNVKYVLLNLGLRDFISILEEVRVKILKAKVNANEMVGTLAAQSVGEPATQMTLNTFHLAGVASTVSMGVPRLNEIINLARNIKTPSMQIFFENGLSRNIENARRIQNQVEFLSLKMVCEASQIVYDPDVMSTVIADDLQFITTYFEMPDEDIDFNLLSKFVVRIVLSRSIMVSKGLTLDFIASKIKKLYGTNVHIITSDENDEKMVVRIRFIAHEGQNLAFFNEVQSEILKIHLKGFLNIKKAYLISDNKSDTSGWCLQTDGINFLPILSAPEIDGTKVMANDIYTIYSVLGVEAARQAILNELSLVIEGNGSYVNHRHMSLLADVMTVKGFLTGITRHGVSRESSSVLKRASFEETVDVFLDSAVTSQLDKIRGVSENVMVGQLAPVGTGNIELVLDTKKLELIAPYNTVVFPENTPGFQSPSSLSTMSIYDSGNFSPLNGNYSPVSSLGFSPDWHSFNSSQSPSYSPSLKSPSYKPVSQSYSPLSGYQASYSPRYNAEKPSSPLPYNVSSPSYSPVSPTYSPLSNPGTLKSPRFTEGYTPSMPYSPLDSTGYKPLSPSYSPLSPQFEETSDTENSKKNKKK